MGVEVIVYCAADSNSQDKGILLSLGPIAVGSAYCWTRTRQNPCSLLLSWGKGVGGGGYGGLGGGEGRVGEGEVGSLALSDT